MLHWHNIPTNAAEISLSCVNIGTPFHPTAWRMTAPFYWDLMDNRWKITILNMCNIKIIEINGPWLPKGTMSSLCVRFVYCRVLPHVNAAFRKSSLSRPFAVTVLCSDCSLQWLFFAVAVPCCTSFWTDIYLHQVFSGCSFAVTVACSDCSLQWLLISMLTKLRNTDV